MYLFTFYLRNTHCVNKNNSVINKNFILISVRFVHATQLTLKPLFFEVPLLEEDPLFAGRQWLLHELESMINGSSPGMLISGSPGTGKTALILQLVEHSCFGRRREQLKPLEVSEECNEKEKQGNATLQANIRYTNEKVFIKLMFFLSLMCFLLFCIR